MTFNFDESMAFLVAKEEQARQRGRENGQKELPATGSSNLDSDQMDIKWDCQKVARNLITATKQRIRTYDDQLTAAESAINAIEALPPVGNITASLEQDIKSYLTERRGEYIAALVAKFQTRQVLMKFRETRDIENTAQAPDSKKAHYQMLLAFAIIELFVSVFFFNNVMDLVESVLLAFGLTFMNIVPAIAVGNYFRNKNGNDATTKVISYLLMVGWLVFVIWFNTAIAIYRSGIITLQGSTGAPVLEHGKIFFDSAVAIFKFQAPPINDINSIILWLLGISVGIVAAWKGYTADDPIPEHGRKTEEAKGAEEVFKQTSNQLLLHISEAKSKEKLVFQQTKNLIQGNVTQYKSAVSLLLDEISKLNNQVHEVENQFHRLITIYRDFNKERISEAPIYFSDLPDLDITSDLPDVSGYTQQHFDEVTKGLERKVFEKTDALNQLQSQYTAFCEELDKKIDATLADWEAASRSQFENPHTFGY